MFVDTFIKRPILASVCSLIIVLAGLLAIPNMPIAWYPQVAPPTVQVTAVYTGANATTVETAVTTPLEQAINGVEGMLYMSSSSTNSGFSQITITFDVTRDPDIAAVDVQNRVNQAIGRLPAEVRQLGVTVQKVATNFISAGALYSQKGEYDALFVSNYLDVYIRDALRRVPGVADIVVFGERKFSMRVWLDPVRLAARRLTAGDVVNALREQNVNVAAGSVGDSPAREGQTYQISVRAAGRLTEASEFENIIVQTGPDATLVRLRDIGTVELGAESYSTLLRYQGVDAMGFGILGLPTANALDVQRGVIGRDRAVEGVVPSGTAGEHRLRHDHRGAGVHQGGHRDAAARRRPGRAGDVRVSPELAGHAHSDPNDAGVADWRTGVRQPARLLDQYAHAVCDRPGDGDRRGRRDRGD